MTYNEIEAAGLNSFKKLATAVISVLFLPLSTAEAEILLS